MLLSYLRRDNLRRSMGKIAQHLPADGWVRIEQPVQYGHAAESNKSNKLVRSTYSGGSVLILA